MIKVKVGQPFKYLKYKKDVEESNLDIFFDRMFLLKETSIMLNFTTRQYFLVPSLKLDKEERVKLGKFLLLDCVTSSLQ